MRLQYSDIPVPMGGAEDISVLKSDRPLVVAWKERNKAIETVVKVRPLDFYDTHAPGYPNQFDEDLDLEEERERMWRKQIRWSVPRTVENFKQAEKELYHISNLYQNAVEMRTSWYQSRRQKLLDAGYDEATLASVPPPPTEIPALHINATSTCGGEIHKGNVTREGWRNNTVEFCMQCGQVFNTGVYGPTFSRDEIEDMGTKLIPQDPDRGYPQWDSSEDDEVSSEELRQEERQAQEYTRRCMRAYGLLISVSEAASITGHTTQNISNYIAKRRLQSWPDPDDTRYRLVLREEVETLA